MVALLQPPPLLAMLFVLLVTAGALWLGLRKKAVSDAQLSAGTPDQPQSGFATERDEVWGTPDPSPPARQPFSYDRLVVRVPDVDSVEPLSGAEPPPPDTTERPASPPVIAEPAIAPPMGAPTSPAETEPAAPPPR